MNEYERQELSRIKADVDRAAKGREFEAAHPGWVRNITHGGRIVFFGPIILLLLVFVAALVELARRLL